MKIKLPYLNDKIYIFLSLLLLILFSIRSIDTLSYIYDGGHHGSIYLNALEILNGKLPYKDFFSQYGYLNDLINSISVYLLNKDIYGIYINSSIFYFSSILIIGFISKSLSNIYGFIFAIIILTFNHPIPEYPWPNYTAFFFLTLSLFFFNEIKIRSLFISGFFLSLACLSRENFFYFVIPSLLTINFIFYLKNRNFDRFKYLFLGFIIPIAVFFLYLYFNNIIIDWYHHQRLPFIYIDRYETSFLELFKNFFIFFSLEMIFNLVNNPQYLIILLIILFNLFVLIEEIFINKLKDINVIFLCLICLSSFIVSINYEIFRLYTSIAIGLPTIFYKIHKNNNSDTYYIFIFIMLSVSIYSLYFFPKGNVKFFNAINYEKSLSNRNFNHFNYQKWTSDKWNFLSEIKETDENIHNNCDITYILNLTPDAFILVISKHKRSQLAHLFNDHLGLDFATLLQKDFEKKVNKLINQKDIYIITTDNNIKILNSNLDDYHEIKRVEFSAQKKTVFRILTPKTCNIL